MLKNKNVALATLSRVKGRERLMELARAAQPTAPENRELERLQSYLLEWSQHQLEISAPRKDKSESTLAQYMKSDSPTISSLFEGSNLWAMEVLDASMDDLLELARGSDMRSALRVKYLNEGISKEVGRPVRVFRHGRLQEISLVEIDALADEGEKALIPIVKRRNLPL